MILYVYDSLDGNGHAVKRGTERHEIDPSMSAEDAASDVFTLRFVRLSDGRLMRGDRIVAVKTWERREPSETRVDR